jgi:polyhydroxyalkanoate synthesis regulator phasin
MAQETKSTANTRETIGAASDLFWDGWTQSLGMLTWAGEQAEKLTRSWIDQGRVTREEGLRLQREMVEQARANQRDLQELIAKSIDEQTAAFRTTMEEQLAELRARVEQLNSELRAWREKAGA